MSAKKVDGDVHVPPSKLPADDAGYLAVLTQAVFQAGFSWKVVRDKWENFEKAFDGFALNSVANYDERDVERLVSDASIIRNGRKIKATLENARVMRDLVAEHGSFHDYLRTMDGKSYSERSKILSKQFKWLGRTGVFFFLGSVAEDVPEWEER